ncbi:hypothetical protein POX_d05876 [Penicillium oxalicum]|uniref:Uncharacterized protein n=1 Tax=Penicillium oxalicum (strain 114-2 / CGMCC 5302) TaxID=933388 RepID=S7ZNL1_PENO1|nr:hypothetical protein POX_d05876 [Penicillium oxalicum]EPS31944.1 hypothetical protein PDE_06903 [Penicillium oxalicum 114-2]KAI2790365.1 hypothetical protein POX_d05876 [Penicillium oxalicum]
MVFIRYFYLLIIVIDFDLDMNTRGVKREPDHPFACGLSSLDLCLVLHGLSREISGSSWLDSASVQYGEESVLISL